MHKPFSCALLLLLAGCTSLPQEIKARPAFTDFDPRGTYQLVDSELVTSPTQEDAVTIEWLLSWGGPAADAPPQTFQVRSRRGKGRALVDGDKVYVVIPEDAVIFVGTPTSDGYEALIGWDRLFMEKGRGGRGLFNGSYRVEGINVLEDPYKTHVDISRRGDICAMRYDTLGAQFAGLGFVQDGRLIAAKYPTVVLLRRVVAGIEYIERVSFGFNGIYVGAFKRKGERLVGRSLVVGSKGQPVLGREVLQLRKGPEVQSPKPR